MRFDLLLHHCADMGIDVDYDDLGSRHGLYYRDLDLIILNRRCTSAQLVGALSHEVGHAVHLDHCSSPAHEKRADRTGASLIITPTEYAAAEDDVGPHVGAIAKHLEVTRRVIIGWRDWYHRLPLDERVSA